MLLLWGLISCRNSNLEYLDEKIQKPEAEYNIVPTEKANASVPPDTLLTKINDADTLYIVGNFSWGQKGQGPEYWVEVVKKYPRLVIEPLAPADSNLRFDEGVEGFRIYPQNINEEIDTTGLEPLLKKGLKNN